MLKAMLRDQLRWHRGEHHFDLDVISCLVFLHYPHLLECKSGPVGLLEYLHPILAVLAVMVITI